VVTRRPLLDIAVEPTSADRALATTPSSKLVSFRTDCFRVAMSEAPLLAYIDWPSPCELVGVAPDGTVYTSSDGGLSWSQAGEVPGQPTALEVTADRVFLATTTGLYAAADAGRDWEPLFTYPGSHAP
jgi:hypothetical protein